MDKDVLLLSRRRYLEVAGVPAEVTEKLQGKELENAHQWCIMKSNECLKLADAGLQKAVKAINKKYNIQL